MLKVQIFITLATHHGWSITQLDVSNTFLPGKHNETILMQHPLGFIDQ